MRFLTAAIVLAPIMLIGASPVFAAQPGSLSLSNAPIRLAADTYSTTERDTYTQRAKNEVQDWQRKVHAFGEQTKVEGQAANNLAGKDLNEAWRETDAASHMLQAASAEGWESAKTSYEKASHHLADAWHKVHPEEK